MLSGIDHIEHLGDNNLKTGYQRRQAGDHQGRSSNDLAAGNIEGRTTSRDMKTEMFRRLDRRSEVQVTDDERAGIEVDSTAAVGTDSSPVARYKSRARSRNVLDREEPMARASNSRASGNAHAHDTNDQERKRRDSDDDTDYGDMDEGEEADDDSEDDELWKGFESFENPRELWSESEDEDSEDEGKPHKSARDQVDGQEDQQQPRGTSSSSVDRRTDRRIQTVLGWVTRTLNLMIEHGADLYRRDSQGNTCIHYAAKYDQVYMRLASGRPKSTSSATEPATPHPAIALDNFMLSDVATMCSRNEIASIVVTALFQARNFQGKSPW